MAPKTKTFPLHRLSKKQLIIYGTTFALIGIILLYKSFALNPNLPGDVNNDNTVNITDLSILLSNYNTNYSPADFNSDGIVSILDLSILLSNYGKSYTPSTPTLSLTANPTSISSGSSSTLSWSSTNATSCTASGAWSGSKNTSGSQSVSPTSTSTYTLTCTGAGGSGSSSTTITVSTGGGGSTGKLLWAPPTLTNPQTITVTNSNSSFSLNNNTDYIIKLPSTPLTVAGGLQLIGGHNIVIIGGEISHPTASNNIADEYGIALYRQTGTVHIEGVWIHGIGIGQAILIAHTDSSSANSIIQIENSRLESLHVVGTIHTDTIQSYGGPRKLRLYNNTMISNGVVIQTQPCDVGSGPTPTQWDYRKLDLVQQTPDAYGLWKNCTAWDEYHDDIYYHYDPGDVAPYGAWAEGNCWSCWNPGGSWPITGKAMNIGYRPGGYLVDSADVGIGYTSPGYQ